MRKADKRGLRVDFLALHWYAGTLRPETVEHLRRYLTELHRTYHRPIWLTEFAIVAHDGYGRLIYPSQKVQARFAAQATRMLYGCRSWRGTPGSPSPHRRRGEQRPLPPGQHRHRCRPRLPTLGRHEDT